MCDYKMESIMGISISKYKITLVITEHRKIWLFVYLGQKRIIFAMYR